MDKHSKHIENAAIVGLMALALGMRLWNIEQNAWGAEYYSAAVRSMLHSWHNFFYLAFDPAGFMAVDKPPVALWIQALSAWLLGYSALALLLPQAILGALSVLLLYLIVRPAAGWPAALGAGLIMALDPISVAVSRTNNMDSCLVAALLITAYILLRAAASAQRRLLLGAAAALGMAFNVKMLAAFVLLPACVFVVLSTTQLSWRQRAQHLALAAGVFVAVALSWSVMVELTPPAERPYVGGSKNNSMFELILGHNAAKRFSSPLQSQAPVGDAAAAASTSPRAKAANAGDSEARTLVRALRARQFVAAAAGPLRLTSGLLAAQFAWFLPLALIGALLGLWRRTEGDDGLAEDAAQRWRSCAFLSIWALSCWILYSSLGGIFHYYYLATLTPPLAALAGMGGAALLRPSRHRYRAAVLTACVLLVTAMWQLHIHASALSWAPFTTLTSAEAWLSDLQLGLSAGLLLALVGLGVSAVRAEPRRSRAYLLGASAVGLLALALLPTTWALSSVLVPGQGLLPAADLNRLLIARRAPRVFAALRVLKPADIQRLENFLLANRGGARYLLSTTSAMLAAPLIIATDAPVLSRGGFQGLDPALDAERLAALVAAGELRFAMVGDVSSIGRHLGTEAADQPLADWIRAHGAPVAAERWRSTTRRDSAELYDLRPELGLVTD